eukprot:g17588.t1
MLRRKPTRIELTTDDVQDYEAIKKKAEENKRKQEELESTANKTKAEKAEEEAAKAADAAAAAAAADEPSRRQGQQSDEERTPAFARRLPTLRGCSKVTSISMTPADDAPAPSTTASAPHTVANDAPAVPAVVASHTGPLIEVGFWADPRDERDERPHPTRLVDEEWGKTTSSLAVGLYLRCGFLESFELGYSFCRLGCGGGGAASGGSNKFMGCTTLTDGKYVWPEGLSHYVSEHSVRLPDDFVSHALGNLRALREAQAGGRLRWDVDDRGRGRTAPLAPGTAVFLRDKTTLGLALPPEPEFTKLRRFRGSEEGICSCMTS